MIRVITAALSAALLLSVPALSAHENYRIIGTVVKVTDKLLDVKQTKDGKTISMDITEKSKVTRDKKPVKASDIKPGAHVVVDAHGDDIAFLEVVEVRLVPAPKK